MTLASVRTSHYPPPPKLYAIRYTLYAFLLLWSFAPMAHAKGMSLIRDAEIEFGLSEMINPILDVAGVDRSAFRLYIVQNDQLNAFVAGGQNIFIHTGLLLRAENYQQIMGVIAHEVGHIAGGHLARRQQDLQDIGKQSLILQLLAGAALALGRGDAGMAILGAGAQVLQRGSLAYTRVQERSADQAGLNYLQQLGVSSQGLLEFFKILQEQQKLFLDNQPDPYLQSHPLNADRIQAVETFLRQNPTTDNPNARWANIQSRLRAKLAGFLWPKGRVLNLYPPSDNSFAARYARAIAEFKWGEGAEAVVQINALLREYPDDPYLYELRGQMRLESPELAKTGRAQYIADYKRAVDLAPRQALLRLGLAQALLAEESADAAKQALPLIAQALRQESGYGQAWRLESIARGRVGEIGQSALALAELALLQGDKKRAKEQAQRASQILGGDTPARQRALDIKQQIDSEEKK
jgi:predicted Zn-dependent protease